MEYPEELPEYPAWSTAVEARKPTTPEEFRAKIEKMWEEECMPKTQYWVMGPKEYAWWLNYLSNST
jgi:hypothetical protein